VNDTISFLTNLIIAGQHGSHDDLKNAATFKVGDSCVHHHILSFFSEHLVGSLSCHPMEIHTGMLR
jgi:hypothetical protein